MTTRRGIILGAGSFLAGSGVLKGGAFAGSTTSPSTDFQVMAIPRLVLVPGRDDEAYVSVESGTEYDHVRSIDVTESSPRARSRFERLVEVVNNAEETIDELYFKFEVESDSADPGDIAGCLSIVSASNSIPATGDTNYLQVASATGEDADVLEPGEAVPFGVEVNLQPSNGDTSLTTLPDPDTFDVSLLVSISAN